MAGGAPAADAAEAKNGSAIAAVAEAYVNSRDIMFVSTALATQHAAVITHHIDVVEKRSQMPGHLHRALLRSVKKPT